MALTQVIQGTSEVHPVGVLTVAAVGAVVVAGHVLRAVVVRDTTAATWLGARLLPTDPRSVATVREHLRRLRWTRAFSSCALVAICAGTMAVHGVPVSFVSLPFLIAVLVAEVMAPEPRRARVISVAVEHRSPSYFAPGRALLVARTAMWSGVALSLLGLTTSHLLRTASAVHAVVLVLGALAVESALIQVSRRGLPDRQPDLAVDTALRVASARAITAGALVFGTFGLFLGMSFARLGSAAGSEAVSLVVSEVLNVGLLASGITAFVLVQPLRSWSPRT